MVVCPLSHWVSPELLCSRKVPMFLMRHFASSTRNFRQSSISATATFSFSASQSQHGWYRNCQQAIIRQLRRRPWSLIRCTECKRLLRMAKVWRGTKGPGLCIRKFLRRAIVLRQRLIMSSQRLTFNGYIGWNRKRFYCHIQRLSLYFLYISGV